MGRQRLLVGLIIIAFIGLWTVGTSACTTTDDCNGFKCISGTCGTQCDSDSGYALCGNACRSGAGVCCSGIWYPNGQCCGDGECADPSDCRLGVCSSSHTCTSQSHPDGTKIGDRVCCSGQIFTGDCCSASQCPDNACTLGTCTDHACSDTEYDFGHQPSESTICCGSPLTEYAGDCCVDSDCADDQLCTGDVCDNHVCTNDPTPENTYFNQEVEGESVQGICCEAALYPGRNRNCCSNDDVPDDHLCLDNRMIDLNYVCEIWQDKAGHTCTNTASFSCGAHADYSEGAGCLCQPGYHLTDVTWMSGCTGEFEEPFEVPFELVTFTEGTTNCDFDVFPPTMNPNDPGTRWQPGYRWQKVCDMDGGADGEYPDRGFIGTTMDIRYRAGIEMVSAVTYQIHVYKLDSHTMSGSAKTGFCIKPMNGYRFAADNPAGSIDNIQGIESIDGEGRTCFYVIDHNTPLIEDVVVTVRLAKGDIAPIAVIENPFAASEVGPYWVEVECMDTQDGNDEVQLVAGKQPGLVSSGGIEFVQAWDDAPASAGTKDEDIKFRVRLSPHEEIEGKLRVEVKPLNRRVGTNNMTCSVCVTPKMGYGWQGVEESEVFDRRCVQNIIWSNYYHAHPYNCEKCCQNYVLWIIPWGKKDCDKEKKHWCDKETTGRDGTKMGPAPECAFRFDPSEWYSSDELPPIVAISQIGCPDVNGDARVDMNDVLYFDERTKNALRFEDCIAGECNLDSTSRWKVSDTVTDDSWNGIEYDDSGWMWAVYPYLDAPEEEIVNMGNVTWMGAPTPAFTVATHGEGAAIALSVVPDEALTKALALQISWTWNKTLGRERGTLRIYRGLGDADNDNPAISSALDTVAEHLGTLGYAVELGGEKNTLDGVSGYDIAVIGDSIRGPCPGEKVTGSSAVAALEAGPECKRKVYSSTAYDRLEKFVSNGGIAIAIHDSFGENNTKMRKMFGAYYKERYKFDSWTNKCNCIGGWGGGCSTCEYAKYKVNRQKNYNGASVTTFDSTLFPVDASHPMHVGVSFPHSLPGDENLMRVDRTTSNGNPDVNISIQTLNGRVCEGECTRYYRRTVIVPGTNTGTDLKLTCDASYELFVNGESVGSDDNYTTAESYSPELLSPIPELEFSGINVLAIRTGEGPHHRRWCWPLSLSLFAFNPCPEDGKECTSCRCEPPTLEEECHCQKPGFLLIFPPSVNIKCWYAEYTQSGCAVTGSASYTEDLDAEPDLDVDGDKTISRSDRYILRALAAEPFDTICAQLGGCADLDWSGMVDELDTAKFESDTGTAGTIVDTGLEPLFEESWFGCRGSDEIFKYKYDLTGEGCMDNGDLVALKSILGTTSTCANPGDGACGDLDGSGTVTDEDIEAFTSSIYGEFIWYKCKGALEGADFSKITVPLTSVTDDASVEITSSQNKGMKRFLTVTRGSYGVGLSLIRFNTKQFATMAPANMIAKVELVMKLSGSTAPGCVPTDVHVRAINEDWAELEVIGATMPDVGDTSYATTTVDCMPGDGTSPDVSFDITSLFNQWVSGDKPNHGLALKPDDISGQMRQFFSSDHQDMVKKPRLVISFRGEHLNNPMDLALELTGDGCINNGDIIALEMLRDGAAGESSDQATCASMPGPGCGDMDADGYLSIQHDLNAFSNNLEWITKLDRFSWYTRIGDERFNGSLDANGDGYISNGDWIALRSHLTDHNSETTSCATYDQSDRGFAGCYDLNSDGLANQDDLMMFKDHLLRTHQAWNQPPRDSGAGTSPAFNGSLDLNGDAHVTNGDWLAFVHYDGPSETDCAVYKGCGDLDWNYRIDWNDTTPLNSEHFSSCPPDIKYGSCYGCPDLDGDGTVDAQDVATVQGRIGLPAGAYPLLDRDRDGDIDTDDISCITNQLNTALADIAPCAGDDALKVAAVGAGIAGEPGCVTNADWIAIARTHTGSAAHPPRFGTCTNCQLTSQRPDVTFVVTVGDSPPAPGLDGASISAEGDPGTPSFTLEAMLGVPERTRTPSADENAHQFVAYNLPPTSAIQCNVTRTDAGAFSAHAGRKASFTLSSNGGYGGPVAEYLPTACYGERNGCLHHQVLDLTDATALDHLDIVDTGSLIHPQCGFANHTFVLGSGWGQFDVACRVFDEDGSSDPQMFDVRVGIPTCETGAVASASCRCFGIDAEVTCVIGDVCWAGVCEPPGVLVEAGAPCTRDDGCIFLFDGTAIIRCAVGETAAVTAYPPAIACKKACDPANMEVGTVCVDGADKNPDVDFVSDTCQYPGARCMDSQGRVGICAPSATQETASMRNWNCNINDDRVYLRNSVDTFAGPGAPATFMTRGTCLFSADERSDASACFSREACRAAVTFISDETTEMTATCTYPRPSTDFIMARTPFIRGKWVTDESNMAYELCKNKRFSFTNFYSDRTDRCRSDLSAVVVRDGAFPKLHFGPGLYGVPVEEGLMVPNVMIGSGGFSTMGTPLALLSTNDNSIDIASSEDGSIIVTISGVTAGSVVDLAFYNPETTGFAYYAQVKASTIEAVFSVPLRDILSDTYLSDGRDDGGAAGFDVISYEYDAARVDCFGHFRFGHENKAPTDDSIVVFGVGGRAEVAGAHLLGFQFGRRTTLETDLGMLNTSIDLILVGNEQTNRFMSRFELRDELKGKDWVIEAVHDPIQDRDVVLVWGSTPANTNAAIEKAVLDGCDIGEKVAGIANDDTTLSTDLVPDIDIDLKSVFCPPVNTWKVILDLSCPFDATNADAAFGPNDVTAARFGTETGMLDDTGWFATSDSCYIECLDGKLCEKGMYYDARMIQRIITDMSAGDCGALNVLGIPRAKTDVMLHRIDQCTDDECTAVLDNPICPDADVCARTIHRLDVNTTYQARFRFGGSEIALGNVYLYFKDPDSANATEPAKFAHFRVEDANEGNTIPATDLADTTRVFYVEPFPGVCRAVEPTLVTEQTDGVSSMLITHQVVNYDPEHEFLVTFRTKDAHLDGAQLRYWMKLMVMDEPCIPSSFHDTRFTTSNKPSVRVLPEVEERGMGTKACDGAERCERVEVYMNERYNLTLEVVGGVLAKRAGVLLSGPAAYDQILGFALVGERENYGSVKYALLDAGNDGDPCGRIQQGGAQLQELGADLSRIQFDATTKNAIFILWDMPSTRDVASQRIKVEYLVTSPTNATVRYASFDAKNCEMDPIYASTGTDGPYEINTVFSELPSIELAGIWQGEQEICSGRGYGRCQGVELNKGEVYTVKAWIRSKSLSDDTELRFTANSTRVELECAGDGQYLCQDVPDGIRSVDIFSGERELTFNLTIGSFAGDLKLSFTNTLGNALMGDEHIVVHVVHGCTTGKVWCDEESVCIDAPEVSGCDSGDNLWKCDPTRNDGADCRCNNGIVVMDRGHKGLRGAMVYNPVCAPSSAPLVDCATATDPACDAWITAGLRASNDPAVCPQGCLYNQTCTETDHFEQGFTRAGDVDGQCRMSCKNTCVRIGSDFKSFEHFTYSGLGSPQAKCDCACVKDCPLGLHCYVSEGEDIGSCGRPQVRCPDSDMPLYCESVDACVQAVSDAALITDEKSCACYGHFWCETSLEGQPCKQNPDECMSMLGDTTDDNLVLVTDDGINTGEQVILYGDESTFTIEVSNDNSALTAHYCIVPQILVRPFECGFSWFSCDPLNWLSFNDGPVMAFVPPLGTDHARITLDIPEADALNAAGLHQAAVGEYVVMFNVLKFIGSVPTGCDDSALRLHEQCDDLENDFCARVLYGFSIPGTGGSCALGREFCGGDCYTRDEGTCCDGVWKSGWNCCTGNDCEEVLGKKHFACVEGDVVRACSEEKCVPGYLLCDGYCKPDDPNIGRCCGKNDGTTVWREGAECCVDQDCTSGHVCQTWGAATYTCTKDCTEYAAQSTHVGCGELCYLASAGACCEANWFDNGASRSCCPKGVTGYDACASTHHQCANNACQPDACENAYALCAVGCHINDGEEGSGLCCSAAVSEGETWIQLASCCSDDDCTSNYMCQDNRCAADKCRTGLYIECGDTCIWDDDGLYACCDGEYFDAEAGNIPCCVGSEEQDCGGGNLCVNHACDVTACKEGYTYCGGECVDTRDSSQGVCCRSGDGDNMAWVWGDCCSGSDCPAELGNFDCRITAAGALFQTRQCTTTCGENLQGCGTSCVGLSTYAFGKCCAGAFIDGAECCREDDCEGNRRCRVDELVPTCAEDACRDGYTFCEGACWPRGTGACCNDQWLVGGTCCGDEDCTQEDRACIDNMCSTTRCASQYTPCGALCIDEAIMPGICCDGERWVEGVPGRFPCCADEQCPGHLACGWDGYCETAQCAAGSELCNGECNPLPGICCGDGWRQNGDCCSDLDCPGTDSCGADNKCSPSPCATGHLRCLGTCVPGECCPGDVNPITKKVCTADYEWSASACASGYLSCAGSCYRTSAGRCCIPENMWEVNWAEGEDIKCCSDLDCSGGRPCQDDHRCATTCGEDAVECGGSCRSADAGRCCSGVWKDGATCCVNDDCSDGMSCDPDVKACVSGSCASGQKQCGVGCFDPASEVCCGEEVHDGACCGDSDCVGGFLCTHMFECSDTECRTGQTYCAADKACHSGKGVSCEEGFQPGGNCCSNRDCAALGAGFTCADHQCTVKGCPLGTVARGNTCATPDERGVICRSEWVPGGDCCGDDDCGSLHACIDNICSMSICGDGLAPCGDMCVDAGRDPGVCCVTDGAGKAEWIAGGNCCGNADCPGGLACTNGRCSEPQCKPGYIYCGGACRLRSKGICCLDDEGQTAWNSGGNCCSNHDCTGGTTCDVESNICSTTDCDGGRGFTACGLGCFDVPGKCCLGEWIRAGECCGTTDCDGLLGRENQRCDHACYSTACDDGYTFCSGTCRDRALGRCCDDRWIPRRTAGARLCCSDADCPGDHACDMEANECNRKRCVAGFELCNNLCVQPLPKGSLCSEDCQCDAGLICSDKGTCVDERSQVQDCIVDEDCTHISKCITSRILAKGLCIDNGYGGKACAYEEKTSEVYCPVHQMCGYESGTNTCVNLPPVGEFAIQLLAPLTDKLMVGDSVEVALRAADATGDILKDVEVSLEFGDRTPVSLLWINSKNSYVTELDFTDVPVGDHDIVITVKGSDVSKQITKPIRVIGLFSLTSLSATPSWISVGQKVLINHALESTGDALHEGLLRWQFRINGERATPVGDGHELTLQMPGSHEIEACALANSPDWLPHPSCKKGIWCCRNVQVAAHKGMLAFRGADGAPRNEFKVDEPVLITVSGKSGVVHCDAAGIDTSCAIEDGTSCTIPALTYSSPGIKNVKCTDTAGSTFKQQLTVLGEIDPASIELSVDLTSIKAGATVSVVTAMDTKGVLIENLEATWTILSNGTAVGIPLRGTVTIPGEPGTYQLELKVSARPDYMNLIKRYEIVVPPAHKASLSVGAEAYAVMYTESISFKVFIKNEGNVAESLHIDVVCAGCPTDTAVLERHEAILAPEEEVAVPITVKGTAVNEYRVEVTVFNNDIDESTSFTLTVSQDVISGVNLAFAERPEHVVEVDEKYDLEVLVTNTGNAQDNFNVKSEDLSFNKAFPIGPGQTKNVKIRVQISEDFPFKVMAWPDSDESVMRTIAGRLKVLRHEFEVTPLTLELEGTIGTKLPVQITVRNTGTADEAIQIDYRGEGRLTMPSFIALGAEESRPVDGTFTVSGSGTGNLTLSLDGHPEVQHTVVAFIKVPVAFEVSVRPESYALMPGESQTFIVTVKGMLDDEEIQKVTVTAQESDAGIFINQKEAELTLAGDAVANMELNVSISPPVVAGEHAVTIHVANDRGDVDEHTVPVYVTKDAVEMDELLKRLESITTRIGEYDANIVSLERQHITPVSAMTALDNAKVKLLQTKSSLRLKDADATQQQLAEIEALLDETDEDLQRAALLKDMKAEERTGWSPIGVLLSLVVVSGGIGLMVRRQKLRKKAAWTNARTYAAQGQTQKSQARQAMMQRR